MAIPHWRRHWWVRAIVGSFGDLLLRVGVGQRFRILTGLPDVHKVQTPPWSVSAGLGSTHPQVIPMTARPTKAETLPQDRQAIDLLGL